MGKQVLKPGKSTLETKSGLTYWLGGVSQFGYAIQTEFDLIKAGSAGITKASVDELSAHIGISRKNMAEDLLNLSVKTLERKSPDDKLDKRSSSHILEIARIMQHAFEVFEDEKKVRDWLSRENKALNGEKPVRLLDTLTGINMVNDILTRIEEGVYS